MLQDMYFVHYVPMVTLPTLTHPFASYIVRPLLNLIKCLVNKKSIVPLHNLKDGVAPFHAACKSGHLEIVRL